MATDPLLEAVNGGTGLFYGVPWRSRVTSHAQRLARLKMCHVPARLDQNAIGIVDAFAV